MQEENLQREYPKLPLCSETRTRERSRSRQRTLYHFSRRLLEYPARTKLFHQKRGSRHRVCCLYLQHTRSSLIYDSAIYRAEEVPPRPQHWTIIAHDQAKGKLEVPSRRKMYSYVGVILHRQRKAQGGTMGWPLGCRSPVLNTSLIADYYSTHGLFFLSIS